MGWLQTMIDERTEWLLDHRKRKITPDMGFPVYLVAVDEIAYFSATAGTPPDPKRFNPLNRDIVARGRAPGIIAIEATQRPSADIVPTSLRDLFGYRWAFRCSTEASSDTILGHGWASKGYTAEDIDPQARGVSWLRAEDGIPRRVKAAYLSDEHIIALAEQATALRHAPPAKPTAAAARSSRSVRVMPHDPDRHVTAGCTEVETNTAPHGAHRIPARRAGPARPPRPRGLPRHHRPNLEGRLRHPPHRRRPVRSGWPVG